MIETPLAFSWLYQIMSTDPVLDGYVDGRIYRSLAPQGASMPYVIMQHQGGHDVIGTGGVRIMVQLVCVVKAVGSASQYATLRSIADRVDSLIHNADGQVTNGEILECVREVPVDYEENWDGVRYQHIGGQYRLTVQAT